MTPSLLVVCPSRNRPERCREMLESFRATVSRPQTRLALYVDIADPQVADYDKLFTEYHSPQISGTFGPRLPVPQVYNLHFQQHCADYYSDANDDFIYHTRDWDKLLIAAVEQHGGLGMAYGRTQNLPTAAVWSARSLRALGWWMPEGFIHQYVDNVHRDLFSMAGQMYLVPEVWTEHKHAAFGAVPWDEGYTQIYKTNDAVLDAAAYETWRKTRMTGDLARLRGAK